MVVDEVRTGPGHGVGVPGGARRHMWLQASKPPVAVCFGRMGSCACILKGGKLSRLSTEVEGGRGRGLGGCIYVYV
eukprot:365456-Chlamydomonas_euryale.AAC.6